jgi:hypothetical protein
MDTGNYCLACGKKLRKDNYINGTLLVYHLKCWNELLSDIKNFDKVAQTKYKYEMLFCGKTKAQIEAGEPIIVSFE